MSDAELTEGAPTLEEALLLYARRAGAEAGYGDLPAKVISYNAAQQTATVQPVVLAPKGGRLQLVAPVLDVQVRWPAGSTWSVVGDLVAGDFGWLRVGGADISAWKMQATENDPTALQRRGALADSVFEPGSQPVSVPLASTAYAVGALVIKAASLLLGSSAAGLLVALDTDAVNKSGTGGPPVGFAGWCQEIETLATAGLGGVVTNPISTITQIGNVVSSATKVKAE
jgi:hypothetical protein